MYDLEKFKNEDVYIRITSLEHYNEVMNWLGSQGITWRSGTPFIKKTPMA